MNISFAESDSWRYTKTPSASPGNKVRQINAKISVIYTYNKHFIFVYPRLELSGISEDSYGKEGGDLHPRQH
jgi:hypothetical protein